MYLKAIMWESTDAQNKEALAGKINDAGACGTKIIKIRCELTFGPKDMPVDEMKRFFLRNPANHGRQLFTGHR